MTGEPGVFRCAEQAGLRVLVAARPSYFFFFRRTEHRYS